MRWNVGFLIFSNDSMFEDPASFCRMSIERGVALVKRFFVLHPGYLCYGIFRGSSHIPSRIEMLDCIAATGTFPRSDEGLECVI